jgi:hypothetical protein
MSAADSIVESARRLVDESPRHDEETLFRALDKLFPWATDEQITLAARAALEIA